ncbi:MAG: hypothetical protein GY898_08355 [Proteobacteria bacterium]|nr:hypothetical protein [Pseudomonadota bacterium]
MTQRLLLLALITAVIAACAPRRGGDDDDATDGNGDACDGIVLTIDGGNSACSDPWTEEGAELSLIAHCESDSCSGEASEGEVWIYPAMLYVDFGDLGCEVTRVEVDITDWAGTGAATVRLADSDFFALDEVGNSQVGDQEIIEVESDEAAAGVAICGFETQVQEIRLY